MKRILIPFLALPFACLAQTDDVATIKKISDEILRNGKAYDLLYQLTKQVGGRLAGSPQFAKAIQWGKASLEKNGADRVFLQECMVPHWVRGGPDKAVITEVDKKKTTRQLDVLALGNSLGSGTVTAPVLAVADFDELEKRKDEVKGKIVYYNNAFDPTNVKTFISYGQGRYLQALRPKQGRKIWCGRCNDPFTYRIYRKRPAYRRNGLYGFISKDPGNCSRAKGCR